MARFSSRGREASSSDREEGGSSRGSFRKNSGGSSSGRSSGGRSSGGYSRGGGQKDGPSFIRVGNITPTKSTDRDTVKDLRSSDIKLWWKVYLPKGTETLTLRQGDRVMIQLGRVHKDAEHFVVGNISLPPESDGEGSEE